MREIVRRGKCPAEYVRELCPGNVLAYIAALDTTSIDSDIQVLSSIVDIISSARDIGVVIASRLSMADHVVSVCHVTQRTITCDI